MNENHRKNYQHGLLWPVLLIVVGVLFLLKNLGFIDALTWDTLGKLWPLIFAAIGFDGILRRKEIVGPVIMFCLTGVFLISNYGWGWTAWNSIWRYWPILVIAFGLEIMVGRRSAWLAALSVLLVLGLLMGLLWMGGFSFEKISGGQSVANENIFQESGDVSQANINISMAAGEMNIAGLDDSKSLIAGNISAGNWQEVRSDYYIQGSTGYYFLRNHNPLNFPGNDWDWNLGLAPDIPIVLESSMGAGEMTLDLHAIAVSSLEASQGVGELTVILPESVSMKGDISQAVGEILVYVPEDVAVRVDISKAISNLDVPHDFDKRGDYYYSPGYENAGVKINLDVSQAIGNIKFRYGD